MTTTAAPTPAPRLSPSQRRDHIAARRAQVAALLHGRFTYRQIVQALATLPPTVGGPFHVSLGTVAQDVAAIRAEWHEQAQASYESMVADQTATLNALLAAHMPRAMTGNAKSSEIVLRCTTRMAALHGLDRPQRFEFSGPGGGPLPFEGRTDEQARARLVAILDRMDANDTFDADDIPDAELVPDVPELGAGDDALPLFMYSPS